MRTAIAALVVIAFGLGHAALAQGRPPPSVFTVLVEEIAFSQDIEALGTVRPKEQAALTLNAADRVTAVYFEDGQRVEAGTTLVALAQREQLAEVESAEAELREARTRLARLADLVEFDAAAVSDRDVARRDVQTTRAALEQVQSQLRDRVLVAPFDGLLGFRQVSVGSYVQPGDVVATIVDDSVMRLDFAVPAIRLSAITIGTRIVSTTDGLADREFVGTVTSIDNAIDPATRSVRVRADLPNTDRALKAGMFMRVTVNANPRMALSVPEEAIQPIGPESFVFVVNDESVAVRTKVEIGQRQAGRVEILSGLAAGDRVITEGVIRTRDGRPVKVVDAPFAPTNPDAADPIAASGGGARATSSGG